MGFIAKDSGGGGDFKKVPPGVYVARCFSLIDMGTQITDGQYGQKEQHKIRIGFEVFGEDDNGVALTINMDGKEMPMTISKTYTMSLHEKAGLRKDLAAWRSRDFTEEEAKGFDISKLLGVYCMLNVTTSENNGKTYTNIAGITPLPQALKNAKPEGVHTLVAFDLDNPDWAVFQGFYEKLQETIKQSPEFAQAVSMADSSSSESEF
jgi:hypothetical protein